VGTVSEAGCKVFIVHARNAWLKGLSPKENREIPPLRYEQVHRLKADFPQLTICINGGIKTNDEIATQLAQLDGVMVGREAYHNPWVLAGWDAAFFESTRPGSSTAQQESLTSSGQSPVEALTREIVEEQMVAYMEREAAAHGTAWYAIARHMLGLRHGLPGSRKWRQVWSDHRLKNEPARTVQALLAQETRL
jgi:tRNA-dihydrouridine synthase A